MNKRYWFYSYLLNQKCVTFSAYLIEILYLIVKRINDKKAGKGEIRYKRYCQTHYIDIEESAMTDAEMIEIAKNTYLPKVKAFYGELKKLGFTKQELESMPSVFLPCWGEDYSKSLTKIVIAGKETYYWISDMYNEMKQIGKDSYDLIGLSLKAFRKDGPAKWGTEGGSKFWQYAAMSLGNLYKQERDDVLNKNSKILKSIGWFNSHAAETWESGGIDHNNISQDKVAMLQQKLDEYDISSFQNMIKVLSPDIVLYFYRDKYGQYARFLNSNDECEFVRNWEYNDDKEAVKEYQFGKTIILNMRHTSWMTRGNMTQQDCAESISQILKMIFSSKNLSIFTFDAQKNYSVDNIDLRTWLKFKELVRSEEKRYLSEHKTDNQTLARYLISQIARELCKINSTMTAQLLILLLNEVLQFQLSQWQYSPERRGPCSVVRTAWKYFYDRNENTDADCIAEAFTRMDGCYAYE